MRLNAWNRQVLTADQFRSPEITFLSGICPAISPRKTVVSVLSLRDKLRRMSEQSDLKNQTLARFSVSSQTDFLENFPRIRRRFTFTQRGQHFVPQGVDNLRFAESISAASL